MSLTHVCNDYSHDTDSHVKIYGYQVDYDAKQMKGKVHFTNNASNHVQTCHGGAMCCVIDDFVGWLGYCSQGQCNIGSGFTAQINTTLSRPITLETTHDIVG